MNSIILFLLFCIPLRLILSYIPTKININYLPYYGILILAMSASFIFIYFTKLRMNAFEANGKTWWNNLRLIHGLLYLCAGIYLIQKDRTAWIPLAVDVLLGLLFFINHHFLYLIDF